MKKSWLRYFSRNNENDKVVNKEKNTANNFKKDGSDDLEQYRQENYKPNSKTKKDDKAKIKQRKKSVIITSVVIVGLGLLAFWLATSFWRPPIASVQDIKNNKIRLYNNNEFDFAENKTTIQAEWCTTTSQLLFTINSGFFSGISFYGWIKNENEVSFIGDNTIYKLYIDPSSKPQPNTRELGQGAKGANTKALAIIDIDSDSPTLSKRIREAVTAANSIDYGPNPLLLIVQLLPTLLIIIMIFYFFKMLRSQGGGVGGESIFGIGKSQAKLAESNVKFSDVAGIQEEKNELMEIVDYLKNPGKYSAMGARAPKGIILYGPPGTGKTLLAKAVAGEAHVPFFEVSGSSFEDMLVGVGAKRVRDLFSKAAKAAPAIIFIDEIDSVASKRGQKEVIGGGGLADQTINQLLAEMDGFSTNTGVVVMAATNRLDVLDPAILRPGRFDRHIQINLPDIKERLEILKIHSRNKNISSSVNLEDIARRTPGFSGAQLENVLNEATLLAVRESKNTITMKNLDEAIDRVIAGPAKTTKVITLDEKKQIAYHEAGHAMVGLHNPGSDVVQKITIIPRGNAAGYTISTPEKQEMSIQRKCDLLAMISATLGGRAAEEFIYGKDKISTGAANDLYKVTNIVRSMVMQLGMSSLGMTQFVPSEGTTSPYATKLYSDETAKLIDNEVNKIISEQYKKALQIISKNKKELDLLVESLLILETITKDQIDYIHKYKKLPKEAQDKKNELSKKSSKKN